MKIRGCGTALITPFRKDGSLDEPALRALVAWQVESGIDFLVPCGTTGETPTLSRDEWIRVVDVTAEVAAGRVPIVAGATSNSTSDAVEKARTIAARPGVDAILTASPYYNKPTQEGQYLHFKAIAEAVPQAVDPLQRSRPYRSQPGTGYAGAVGADSQYHRGQGSQRQYHPNGGAVQLRARQLCRALR